MAEMAGEVAGMRVCLPREYFWEEVDAEVEAALKASVKVFADMGVYVDEISLEELDDLAQLRARGNLTAVETYLNLGKDLEERPDLFDPIVSTRMLEGRQMPAYEYLGLRRDLEDLQRRAQAALGNVDALLTPTTPFPALPVAEVDQQAALEQAHDEKVIWKRQQRHSLAPAFVPDNLSCCPPTKERHFYISLEAWGGSADNWAEHSR